MPLLTVDLVIRCVCAMKTRRCMSGLLCFIIYLALTVPATKQQTIIIVINAKK